MDIKTLVTSNLIDWQGVDVIETRSGKRKPVLRGIPTESFWRAWKSGKTEFKAVPGFALSYELETVSAARTTASGLTSRAGGFKQGTKAKKCWTCDLWVNRKNASDIKARFDLPKVEPEKVNPENCPF
jgi:hypothetical protein